jgi:hypothetical protein
MQIFLTPHPNRESSTLSEWAQVYPTGASFAERQL